MAGERFAIGSSREMSPAGLKGVAEEKGLELVVVCGANMGDIFRRNAFNLGLHVVQSPDAVADAQDGDEFTFDPVTHRLWETENGPECTDEINLIVKGGNFGWGPKETCSVRKPGGTNNSGPKPRRRPKWFTASTIGITGAAFCHGCGIRSLGGQLVFGDVNTGSLRAIHLNAARTGFSSKARVIATGLDGVHSVEVSPTGHIFFSGTSGIYRLISG